MPMTVLADVHMAAEATTVTATAMQPTRKLYTLVLTFWAALEQHQVTVSLILEALTTMCLEVLTEGQVHS